MLFFGSFAVLDLFHIFLVDPFFGEPTPTADIAVDIDSGKNGVAGHKVIACTVGAGIAIESDDFIGLAFGADAVDFHIKQLLIFYYNDYSIKYRRTQEWTRTNRKTLLNSL